MLKDDQGYSNFQVSYDKAFLPCSEFCAGRLILLLLTPKYYFEDNLPKTTAIPLADKAGPCDL